MKPRALILSFAACLGGTACASIWGFEQATDLLDASPEGGAVESGAEGAGGHAGGDAEGGDGAGEVDGEAVDGAGDVDVRDGAAGGADGGGAPGACQDVCVVAPPGGWVGPFAIEEAMGGPPPPALAPCSQGAYPMQKYGGFAQPSAPPASCACGCGSPEGGSCSDPVLTRWNNGLCGQACGAASPVTIQTSCTPLPNTGCNNFKLSASVASAGSCAPSATTSIVDAGWTANAVLCGAPGPSAGACEGGAVCTPMTTSPYELATYCIATSDVAPCPASYPSARTYYAYATDTRACTPCTCGAPSGVNCAGSVTVSDQPGCTHTPTMEPVPSTCINAMAESAIFSGGTPSGGSCEPDGGQPTGAYTPSTPTTICCTK